MEIDEAKRIRKLEKRIRESEEKNSPKDRKKAKSELKRIHSGLGDHTLRLARQLEELTGLEARPTILGHLQRGGTPSAADRVLATRLGTACARYISEGVSGVMVAARGEGAEPVPLEQVAGNKKTVPPDHAWIQSARDVGVSLGD